jgi:hypothetical protein
MHLGKNLLFYGDNLDVLRNRHPYSLGRSGLPGAAA